MSMCNSEMYKIRNNFQCGFCVGEFSDIKDLAIHRLDHLVIALPFLQLCVFCDKESMVLAESLQHILDHLTIDRLEQGNLLKWLSSKHKDEKSPSPMEHDGTDKFFILLPSVSYDAKCLYCHKFIHPDDNLIEHVFEHFLVVSSSQRRRHLKLWFQKFFQAEESETIIGNYLNFVDETKKLNLKSKLLEKLPLFESQKTNTCRYCKLTLENASNLYRHYVDWHSDVQAKAWNCPVCNFKAIDGDNFVEHVYRKHMACILCRRKFTSFNECWRHAIGCLGGCPYCHQKLKFETLVMHLNRNNGHLICPYCQQKAMEVDELKKHMRECNFPPIAVFCPLCKNAQFVEEQRLKNHLKECRPWIPIVPQRMPCADEIIQIEPVRRSNSIKFSDIRGHLSQKISDIIEDSFS